MPDILKQHAERLREALVAAGYTTPEALREVLARGREHVQNEACWPGFSVQTPEAQLEIIAVLAAFTPEPPPRHLAGIDAEIADIVANPATSDWLREALTTSVTRDCVDASNDADRLADLLGRRALAALWTKTPSPA